MKDTGVKIISRGALIALVVLTTLFLLLNSFSIVRAGRVGVITRFGAVNRVVNPGVVLKIPLIENTVTMETRIQKDQVDAQAASKDLQEVKSTIALNYHLRGERAVEVFQNIGIDYKIRVIDPAIQEAFKAATAKFTAEELITKREAVKKEAFEHLKERLAIFNIIVDDFNIVNFDFSDEFNQAIEQKQVAQQNLSRAKLEADTARTQAEGQADAQKTLRESGSLTAEYLQFLGLQKWNGVLPQVVGSATPFINIPVK